MKKSIKALPLIFVVFLSSCGITTSDLKSNPGYARLSYPGLWEVDTELNISLGPWAVRTVLNFAKDLDKQQLKKIVGLRLTVYNVNENSSLITNHIHKSVDQLKEDGRVQTIAVNEGAEKNVVMVKFGDNRIEGFSVLTINKEEAVFVNVIGDLDPQFLDQLLAQVNSNSINEPPKISYL